MLRWTLLAVLLAAPPTSLAQDGPDAAAGITAGAPDGDPEDGAEAAPAPETEEAYEEALEAAYEEGLSDADAERAAREAARQAAARLAQQQADYNARIEKKRKMQQLLLAVLVLLLLWLLSRRSNTQTVTEKRRAARRAPVSPQELARAVFEMARDGNIEGYRGLFLNGGEAARVMGRDAAERYLSQRSPKAMEDALVNMAVQVPPSAVFVGVEEIGEGAFAMKLSVDAKTTALVPIGRAVQVGAIYRLREIPRE